MLLVVKSFNNFMFLVVARVISHGKCQQYIDDILKGPLNHLTDKEKSVGVSCRVLSNHIHFLILTGPLFNRVLKPKRELRRNFFLPEFNKNMQKSRSEIFCTWRPIQNFVT